MSGPRGERRKDKDGPEAVGEEEHQSVAEVRYSRIHWGRTPEAGLREGRGGGVAPRGLTAEAPETPGKRDGGREASWGETLLGGGGAVGRRRGQPGSPPPAGARASR